MEVERESLRAEFAGRALQGLLAAVDLENDGDWVVKSPSALAGRAWQLARVMLEEYPNGNDN